MKRQFKWQEVTTIYREQRPSKHGAEQRWLLNQEKILNEATGETVIRGTIRHPGICVIVPRFADGRLLLMHQYRYPIGEAIWELPAGTLSGEEAAGRMISTEDPAVCAARELLEETGYHAGHLRQIGQCYAMPGSSDEEMHIFLADQLTPGEQSLDIGEVIDELRPFSREEILAMIGNGTIRDAKTLVGLLIYFGLSDSAS